MKEKESQNNPKCLIILKKEKKSLEMKFVQLRIKNIKIVVDLYNK